MLLARDIMRSDVMTLSPETPLPEAAAFLTRFRISGAPVVGPGRRLLGILSQTDLVGRGREKPGGEVADAMTPLAYCAEEETPVNELARFMLRKRIHRIVVARNGHLKGIITATDMLQAMLKTIEDHPSPPPPSGRPGRRKPKRRRAA